MDKLDMSLLSKDSLSRIRIGGQLGGGVSSTSSSSRRRQRASIDTELPRHTRTSFTKCTTRKKRPISRSSTDNFFRVDLSPLELSSMHLHHNYKSGDGRSDRKLDNNNNGSGISSRITNLSQLSRKSVDENISSDVELFTGFIKGTPEPCTTCGHTNQPERLHSHPKVPILKNKLGNSNFNSISIVKKSIQKPVALNFRSDKSKDKMKGQVETKKAKSVKSKTPSPSTTKSGVGNLTKTGDNDTSSKTPKTLICYICNRDYGTASFPIHEPKCLEKWDRENKSLPPSQRRPVPQRPNVPIDHQDWNLKVLEKCQNNENENPDTKPKLNRIRSGPPTVVCEICGRNFGTKSIKIHAPQCLKKWQFENGKLPSNQKGNSALRKNLGSRSEETVQRRKSSAESVSKKTFTCYLCDRNFGSASIGIHETQCLKKWHIENNKLPAQKRKKEPQKPDNTTNEASSQKSAPSATESADLSWKQHLDKLVPCKQCKRTFNPERVPIHERSCKGT